MTMGTEGFTTQGAGHGRQIDMRPLYESSEDLANEQQVAKFLSEKWGCTFKKLPISYHIDWVVMRDKPQAFVELKCRKNESKKYPTLLLSLNKWMRGKELSKELGIPFIVAVKWTDGVFFHTAGSADVSYGFGGRTDREDSQDIEPVVLIPVENFKRIL